MGRKWLQLAGVLVLIISLFFLTGCGDQTTKSYTLTITIEPAEGGTVTPDGGKFKAGTVVTLEVSPAEGFEFSEWAGTHGNNVTEDAGEWKLAMTGNKQVTAVFIEVVDENGEGDEGDEGDENGEGDDEGDENGEGDEGDEGDEGEFAGGAGIEEDPFLVETVQQLDKVRNQLDKHFRQIANLDLSDYGEGEGWQPISIWLGWDHSENEPFTGSYDGAGFKISNLIIERPGTDRVGLFGYAEEAELKNIILEDVDITGKIYVGGLIGFSADNVTITGCSVTGNVKGAGEVGGLVGRCDGGNIQNCHVAVNVQGTESLSTNIGGLVGEKNEGEINDSSATGNVQGAIRAGGLVGQLNDGAIDNSFATGVIDGLYYAGGLIGEANSANLTGTSATGAVTGDGPLGGLIGLAYQTSILSSHAGGAVTGEDDYIGGLVGSNQGTIENCYATGNVEGKRGYVGGLAGESRGEISQSYALGRVLGKKYTGGLVGINTDAIVNSYALGEVIGTEYVGGLAGRNFLANAAVTRSYAVEAVIGENYVGGLVGYNEVIVQNTFAMGNVTGNNGVGGLVGFNASDHYQKLVQYSYSTGEVSGNSNTGGLVGFNNGGVLSSYYNQDTANQDDTDRGTPRGTGEMTYPYGGDTYVDWDFDLIWQADEDHSINDGYPYFK